MMKVTGISDSCAVCWEDIKPSESVYVHDKALHPLHSHCSDQWKKTCKIAGKAFTCPSCNKVIEAAHPIMRNVTIQEELPFFFEGTIQEGFPLLIQHVLRAFVYYYAGVINEGWNP